jgi:dUTP pyrophosphatase
MISGIKFEQLSTIKEQIDLPKRGTKFSAGYDISIIHPKVYDLMINKGMTMENAWQKVRELFGETFFIPDGKETYVFPTGIKAKIPTNAMMTNIVLMLFIRSSMGIKQGIKLSNQTGIIDADYYNNPDNEGHIMVALDIPNGKYLHFDKPTMRVCQGIFLPYFTVDGDNVQQERTGGIGSTGNA